MEHVDLRRLRYFVAVAEEQHFGRAATRLHMSTPPLSQRIMELERDLGVRLFERTSRKVSLTPAGERLLNDARAVIAAAQRFEHTAASLAAPATAIVLGYCHGSEAGATRGARAFRDAHRDITVRLDAFTSTRIFEDLRRGKVDVGIVRAPLPSTVHSRVLAHVPVDHVALPLDHRLAAGEVVTVHDLAGESVFVVDRDEAPTYHDDTVGYLARHNADATWVMHAATQIERVFDMVAVGSGIGWLNAWQAERGTGRSDVVVRRLEPVAWYDDYFVAWRSENDLVTSFVDTLVEVCGT